MAGNRTLTIIKPDAFGAGKAGLIIALLEKEGFTLKAARVLHMTKTEAGEFYGVHKGRPFYAELVEFMSSGPCMPLVLSRGDAVATLRSVIGATDPAEAADGTVRKLYAESKGRNAIHASDSDENATLESGFFFAARQLVEAETTA
jgi:nucleoside-diphosphate kinase